MNKLRFAAISGGLWAGLSLVLVLIAIVQGKSTGYVEVDFRPLTSLYLLITNPLESSRYIALVSQFGFPITGLHTAISVITGFIDGFTSGYLIALFYNLLSQENEPGMVQIALTFGISAGIVFALTSALLALVTIVYSFQVPGIEYNLRPLALVFKMLGVVPGVELLAPVLNSYALYPATASGVFMWALWGFIDGLIGGAVAACLYLWIKSLIFE